MALSNTMDKVGPMCRYVEDCVLVLNAIYGPDKRDGTVADAAFKWNPDAPLAGYKIAYVRSGFEPARAAAAAQGAARRGGAAAAGAAAAGAGRPARAQPVDAGAAGGAEPWTRRRGRRPVAAALDERRKVYQDVLDTLSQARRAQARTRGAAGPVDRAGTIGFILEIESAASFDDLTRSGDVDLLAHGHVAQHAGRTRSSRAASCRPSSTCARSARACC